MAHGPRTAEMERFLAESVRTKDGQPFRPTEFQLRFLRKIGQASQRMQQEDAEAIAALTRRNYRS